MGELGDYTNNNSNKPVDVYGISTATAIAASGSAYHTCALLSNGTIKCWGKNIQGQLGDKTTGTNSNKPVDVYGISTATSIAVGGFRTCALLSDGTIKYWGGGISEPATVTGLSGTVKAIAAGESHTCALMSNGTVKCWGDNTLGQLGDKTNITPYNPVDVYGISTATSIAAGRYHTCALMSDGSIKSWGYNYYGQLGDGYNADRNAPVNVTGLTGTVTATIATGISHTCALLSDGTVKCWGRNDYGQLGNGNTTNYNTPQPMNLLFYTLSTGYNNLDYHDVSGGDVITDINTCASTCSTTPTCQAFLFNASGLGGAYTTKKCAFKDSKVPGNTLAGAAFYSKY
jgi:alpha-tubulin suppressor-like RCC1 family protein